MKVKGTKKLEKSRVALTVEVRGEEFTTTLDKMYRTKGRKLNIPGFRPGKATRRQIEALYGEGVFYNEVIQELYPAALEQAIESKKLDFVELDDIKVESVDKEGFEFVATVVVRPEAAVKEYKGLPTRVFMSQVTPY